GRQDQYRRPRVEQHEINKSKQAGNRGCDHVHSFTANPIREVTGDWNPKESQDRTCQQPDEQEIARHRYYDRAVREEVGEVDVTRSLLSDTSECRQDDLLRMTL